MWKAWDDDAPTLKPDESEGSGSALMEMWPLSASSAARPSRTAAMARFVSSALVSARPIPLGEGGGPFDERAPCCRG